MMMECPRCGFTQPKDQYCASCGLDVEHYVAKPKPVWVRTLQNSNLSLSLIAILLVLVIGYLVISQGARIGRNIGLIHGVPLSSRDAADPTVAPPEEPTKPAAQALEAEVPEAATPLTEKPVVAAATPAPAAPDNQKIEVTSWEVPRDALPAMLADAQRLAEGSEGRAYIWTSPSKIVEMVRGAGRHVGRAQSLASTNGTQLAIETPQGGSEAFQFGLYFQVSKTEKDLGIKWDSTLVLAAGDSAGGPAIRNLAEAHLTGQAPLTPDSVVMLVFDPGSRTPREEYVTHAGPGPWSIFSSPDFRSGTTDWVMLIQLK